MSCILKAIYAFVGFTFVSPVTETVAYVIVSAILGFGIGKIITHRWFNNILSFLHVGRTTNDNIWLDVIKPHTWVRVFMKDGKSYYGLCKNYEPFEREPIMALHNWQLLKEDGTVKTDYHNSDRDVIILNLKDFDRIELVYT